MTVDVGGTFSDVTVTNGAGDLWIAKSPTRERTSVAVVEALDVLGAQMGTTADDILTRTDIFVYSTTLAINAILEKRTARTALLVTAGFPDILTRREGGRADAFDNRTPFPPPYVPRQLTFEVPERIDSEGQVVRPLDELAAEAIAARVRDENIEAVAVCLLWSVVNPVHELTIARLLDEDADGVAVTLSHQVWPALGEYRRASATAIDASLKPIMTAHLRAIDTDLRARSFGGELLAATSFGGVMHLEDLSRQPIYSVKSGPALAPTAGRAYAATLTPEKTGAPPALNVVVCDTGGTSFDVSLVRDGAVVLTGDTWLGGRFVGDLLPTSSVDARSIGAGGGSIATLDPVGLLRVGPESAGAQPGPACYGLGGIRPTVTDAAAVLGYLDPDYFMGGRLLLDLEAARKAIGGLSADLGRSDEEAALAVLIVANEHMADAIRDITVNEGLDPRECRMVAGGGAAGLTIGAIAGEVGASSVLIPSSAGALSAVGGQYGDIVAQFSTVSGVTSTADLDIAAISRAWDELRAKADPFVERLQGRGVGSVRMEYFAETRYAFQVWTMELPVDIEQVVRTGDPGVISAAFDHQHERVYAVSEPGQVVEILSWRVRVTAEVGVGRQLTRRTGAALAAPVDHLPPRRLYFGSHGWLDAQRHHTSTLTPGASIPGPALLVDETTTLVVYPGSTVEVTPNGDYLMKVQP